MGAEEDLRAALGERQLQADTKTREQAALDERRGQYEAEERAVRERLHGVAGLTLQALVEHEAPKSIAIEPEPVGLLGKLFSSPKRADGWRVTIGGEAEVLCPDGTLVRPQISKALRPPRFSTLTNWIDQEMRAVRTGYGDSAKTTFQEAFKLGNEMENQRSQAQLKSQLAERQSRITKTLASLLHERGISL